MHIHESYHSLHTPGGGLFFCPTVFHQNSQIRCLSIFQSPSWLAGCLGITTFGMCREHLPSGEFLWQCMGTCCSNLWKPEVSSIHLLRPIGHTDACNIIRLWPSWPCPVWSALETFWIFVGSSCSQQVLHLHLPFAHLWAGKVSDAVSVPAASPSFLSRASDLICKMMWMIPYTP